MIHDEQTRVPGSGEPAVRPVDAAGAGRACGPRPDPAHSAGRIAVATTGLLACLAGIEHGIGEILQGPVPPPGPVIQSWADSDLFEILNGEPALTVVPDLLLTGLLAVLASLAVGIWSVWFAYRRHGGTGLILLSVLLLLVGGGFAPPLLGVIAGVAATRMRAPLRRPGRVLRGLGAIWRWILVVTVAAYLMLMPGTLILDRFLDVSSVPGTYALTVVALGGTVLALIASRAEDRRRASPGR